MASYTTCLPICFYPTTLAIIDDDTDWLDILKAQLRELGPSRTFDHPIIAKEALLSREWKSFEGRHRLQALISNPSQTIGEAMLRELTNKDRYRDTAVVIIDYRMPQMNGIELCRKLNNIDTKKIMLTAEADTHVVLNAFNDRLIDAYLQKGVDNLTTILTDKIYALRMEYFTEHSRRLFDRIQINEKQALASALFDAEFAIFFQHFIKEHSIKEFYFYSAPGDYILIDQNEQLSWLLIRDAASQFPEGVSSQMIKTNDDNKYYFAWTTEQPVNCQLPKELCFTQAA